MTYPTLQSYDVRPPAGPSPYGRQSVRVGAALGVLGVALIVAGFALIAPAGATITSSSEEIAAFYADSGLTRVLTGGLLECAGFVLFLAFTTMLTGHLRGAGAAGELLPAVARLAATVYVSICVVPGMAAGGVALWLAHRESPDPALLQALNTLRGFSYFVALLFFASFLVCVGVSATVTGRLPRWAAWSALAIGVPLAATIPLATAELPDMFALLGLAWVLAVSVTLVRNPSPVEARA